MVLPFSQLPVRMNVRAGQVERNAGKIIRTTARTIDRGVIEDTRVDTGEARSNWVVQVDRPFTSRIPPYAPGKNLGISERGNASAAIAQGAAAIRGFNPKFNRSIFITNNAPHIGILNSKDGQFVQMNIMQAQVQIRNMKLLD